MLYLSCISLQITDYGVKNGAIYISAGPAGDPVPGHPNLHAKKDNAMFSAQLACKERQCNVLSNPVIAWWDVYSQYVA